MLALFFLFCLFFFFFFFNDTATTEIYTLSLHDALPICGGRPARLHLDDPQGRHPRRGALRGRQPQIGRAQSELQSHSDLVCRLLLEKKKSHTVPRPLLSDIPNDSAPKNAN